MAEARPAHNARNAANKRHAPARPANRFNLSPFSPGQPLRPPDNGRTINQSRASFACCFRASATTFATWRDGPIAVTEALAFRKTHATAYCFSPPGARSSVAIARSPIRGTLAGFARPVSRCRAKSWSYADRSARAPLPSRNTSTVETTIPGGDERLRRSTHPPSRPNRCGSDRLVPCTSSDDVGAEANETYPEAMSAFFRTTFLAAEDERVDELCPQPATTSAQSAASVQRTTTSRAASP